MWPVRVYGASSRQEVLGDLFVRYPDMVAAAEVALVYWTILDTPFVEGHPGIRVCEFMHRADDREA